MLGAPSIVDAQGGAVKQARCSSRRARAARRRRRRSRRSRAAAPEAVGPPSKAVTQRDRRRDRRGDEPRHDASSRSRARRSRTSISYKITEVDVNDVAASLGQTTSQRNRHFVNLEARVRVGIARARQRQLRRARGRPRSTARRRSNLPLEATPRIARARRVARHRRRLQGGADPAAREARGAQGRRRRASTDVPAWTTEKPLVSEEPVLVAAARDARRARGAREGAVGGVPRSGRRCATRASR